MKSFLRGFVSCVVAVAVFAPCAQAYVLIDDFTQGVYTKTITGQGTDVAAQHGLDPSHIAFGERDTIFNVGVNFFNRPVKFSIGAGEGRVETDTHEMNTSTVWDYGNSNLGTIDLSKEEEIRVDQFTVNPALRLADVWSVFVRDRRGHTDNVPAWISRPGGIAFRKQDFNSLIDWSNIEFFRFEQRFTTGDGPHPFVYSVTKIYAVPEEPVWLVLVSVTSIATRHLWKRN